MIKIIVNHELFSYDMYHITKAFYPNESYEQIYDEYFDTFADGMEEVTDELRIIIDREKAIEHGLTVAQAYAVVAEKLSTASQATTLNGAEKDYAVYVDSEENTTLTREALESITIEGSNADGEKVDVLLSDIARFESAKGFSSINRSEQSRYVTVSAAIAEGHNVGLVAADIEEQLEK